MEHPIGNLMDTTMNKIKEMVDVNTIVGEPITAPDGTLIIPVSKVTYGFAVRRLGSSYQKENKRLLWRRQRRRRYNSACCIFNCLSGRSKTCFR